MQSRLRAACLGVIATALLAACSKSLAPVTPGAKAKTEASSGPEWTSARVREPQTAFARLRCIGSVVTLDVEGRPRVERNAEFLVDADELSFTDPEPPDTVPEFAEVKQIRWRVPGGTGNEFVVDNHPQQLGGAGGSLPVGTLSVGVNLMNLLVPERAGGGIHTVWLQSNFVPEVWWAGPDVSRFPPSSDGDGRAVDVTDWATFTTVPAWPPDGRGFFGPDSFGFVPPQRMPPDQDFDRRTFYEIWGDRIYARSEGDAVHQGAWVVFMVGGFDRDSPYIPHVNGPAPTLPPGFESQPELYPLLIEQGLIGSPIGFRHWVPVKLPSGAVLIPAESTTYPNFDVSSIFYRPQVASYSLAQNPGKAYAVATPEDSRGYLGRLYENPIQLADRVDAGGGTPADRILRRRVLTFHVRAAEPVESGMASHAGRGSRRAAKP